MEASSDNGCRCRVPWLGLLLAVSLLLFWISPINGGHSPGACQHPTIKHNNINLCIQNIPRDAVRLFWYKGDFRNMSNRLLSYTVATNEVIPGPANNTRLGITQNGYLRMLKISKVDTGYYTVMAEMPNNQTTTRSIYFYVQEPMNQHSPQVSRSTVPVNSTVFIACLTRTSGCSVSWFFNDRRLHLNNRMRQGRDQMTLAIMPVKMEDAGQYHCKFVKRLFSGQSERLRLDVVNRSPPSYRSP